MPHRLGRLRLAALNIDGVLLNDTFSPVIHAFVTGRGGAYTADTERAVFSQPQHIAGRNMAAAVPQELSGEEALAAYFEEREARLAEHPVAVLDGAIDLVRRLRGLGLRTVCYGGLPAPHFDRFLGEWAELFDGPRYVCTNDFRPGIHEITTGIFGLEHGEALFVDDVAKVAETARALDVPFIGHPSEFEHSFQRQLMHEAGVRYVVDSLEAIDEPLVRAIDAEALRGTVWSGVPAGTSLRATA
ncbi:HAD family phosphatase [Streptomyces sp. TBY4]|uniref:HAD family phosphatase n=1 Tax=Streptomyces sp. TBY4 TaxID=2962030 RepID=UPI0020B72D6D|nr:HAD family phosphatase [Streptomyces sp. TBY4]MCP3758854.1 HAD family phosphatase [Streptomyces sp. TBY4]